MWYLCVHWSPGRCGPPWCEGGWWGIAPPKEGEWDHLHCGPCQNCWENLPKKQIKTGHICNFIGCNDTYEGFNNMVNLQSGLWVCVCMYLFYSGDFVIRVTECSPQGRVFGPGFAFQHLLLYTIQMLHHVSGQTLLRADEHLNHLQTYTSTFALVRQNKQPSLKDLTVCCCFFSVDINIYCNSTPFCTL